MSKSFDDTMKQIMNNGKQLNLFDNNISEIKDSIKILDNKIDSINEKLGILIDIVNSLSVFIEDAEDINDQDMEDDEEDWTPYDERNFLYRDRNDEDDDDEWSNSEDQS
jgi:hypothetical protein